MKTFINILLTILVCVGLYFSVTYTGDYTCRRIRVLDNDIQPPPGVNPQALFNNIWVFLQFSEIVPNALARVYPRLSSVCFKNFSDHKLSEAEYNEVVSKISEISGVAIDGLFKPLTGLHRYEIPPDALRSADSCGHIEISCPAFALGSGFTLSTILSVAEHPLLSVTVTEYVVVTVGFATGFAMFGLLSDDTGDHK